MFYVDAKLLSSTCRRHVGDMCICRQFLADIACRSDTERAPTSVFCDVNCRHHTNFTQTIMPPKKKKRKDSSGMTAFHAAAVAAAAPAASASGGSAAAASGGRISKKLADAIAVRKAAGSMSGDDDDDNNDDDDDDAAAAAADAAAAHPIAPYFGATGDPTAQATSLPPLPGFDAFRGANSDTVPLLLSTAAESTAAAAATAAQSTAAAAALPPGRSRPSGSSGPSGSVLSFFNTNITTPSIRRTTNTTTTPSIRIVDHH